MEDYHSLDKLITFKGNVIEMPKGLVEVSDRAAVFAADNVADPLLKVTIDNGKIRILGKGLTGWYRETKKDVTYEGPPMVFYIAPELLKHISEEQYRKAEITEGKLKVEGSRWTYVTVLGRPGEAEKEEE
jgi:hypothetical protein